MATLSPFLLHATTANSRLSESTVCLLLILFLFVLPVDIIFIYNFAAVVCALVVGLLHLMKWPQAVARGSNDQMQSDKQMDGRAVSAVNLPSHVVADKYYLLLLSWLAVQQCVQFLLATCLYPVVSAVFVVGVTLCATI